MAKYYIINEYVRVCSTPKKRDWMCSNAECKHPKRLEWVPVNTLYKTIGGAKGYITQVSKYSKTERRICELDSDDLLPIDIDVQEKYEKLEAAMTKAAARADDAKKKAEDA